MERKVVTVMGSQIGKEEKATLHTATCECGGRIVRAKKESSLKFYIGNEKYKAKCCGSKLTYTGEKEFIGEELVETTMEVVENQTIENQVENKIEEKKEEENKMEVLNGGKSGEQKVDGEIKVTGEKGGKVRNIKEAKKTVREIDTEKAAGLIEVGRKGITNFQMIPAIKANSEDKEMLKKLYTVKPEIFKSSALYTPDNVKVTCLEVIREFEPSFKMPMGKKMAAELEAKELEKNNKAI